MKKNKIIMYIILAVLAVFAVFLIFGPKAAGRTSQGLILFTRYDCPHCQNVENYIEQNGTREKIKFSEKEIHETANARLFFDAIKKCGIENEQAGVPMFYDGQTCYVGDENIIEYLRNNGN